MLACVVLKQPRPGKEMADTLVRYCLERIAYYKAPGWIHFVPEIPTTGTQKIQKHSIYPKGTDPRSLAEVLDMRPLKRRQ
ncbi:AMP-binding domain protein [compost metagenome]